MNIGSIVRHLAAIAGVIVSLTGAVHLSPSLNATLLGGSSALLAAEALGSHIVRAMWASLAKDMASSKATADLSHVLTVAADKLQHPASGSPRSPFPS